MERIKRRGKQRKRRNITAKPNKTKRDGKRKKNKEEEREKEGKNWQQNLNK